MRCWLALTVLAMVLAAVNAQCPHSDPGLVSWTDNLASFQRSPPLPWHPLTGGPWHIEIPANTRVLVDADFSVDPLPNIVVRDGAALVFADLTRLEFDVQNIRLDPGASLIAGSLECPIENKLILTFHGDRPADADALDNNYVLGKDESAFVLGHKGIGVCSGATISLHGHVDGPSWTRLSQTASASQSEVRLQQAVGWKSGDEIVIATTDFPSCNNGKCAPDQTEQHTIHEVLDNGQRVVLTQALKYDHWGQDGTFGEVGLLTRHVVLRGDDNASSESFGGHLMMRKAAKAELRGVEITRFGQLGVLGRYPVHFHKLGEHGNGAGMYVRHVSLHHLFQRCITIHDTRHVEITDNVAYSTRGHCYFLEDASEIDNTFVRNLGINAFPIVQAHMVEPYNRRFPLPSDATPAVFWITNPLNVFESNAAVASTFGYWFSMPKQPNGESVGEYPTVFPRTLPLRVFRGNVAHSMLRNGIHIDDMQLPNDNLEQARYTPYEMTQDLSQKLLNSSCGYEDWACIDDVFAGAKPTVGVVFDSLVVYKCRDTGIWARGGPFEFTNLLLMDNLKGILCPPGPNLVSNSRIVAETSNRGVHVRLNGVDDYCFNSASDCRARPHVSKSDADVVGYSMYDREGPQYVRNVQLEGFRTRQLHCKTAGGCSGSGVRRAGGYGHLPHGFNPHWTENVAEGLSFVDSPERVLVEHDRPNQWYPYFNSDKDGPGDGPRNFMFYDRDGSVSGWVGGWVQSDYSTTRHAECETHDSWHAVACPPSNHHRVQTHMVFTNSDISAGNFQTPTCSQDMSTCVSQGAGSSGCHLCDSWGMDYTRAHVYALGDDEALPVTGIAYYSQFRRNFGANLPLRRGYAIRFNHPTPPLITIRAQSSAPGDWLVWVIPYPTSASVAVLDRKNKRLPEATSLLALDGDHFYRDGEDVYIMMYVKPEHGVTERTWGFRNEAGYARVRVEADCGKSCTVGGLGLSIPPPLPQLEDSFAGMLETCQSDGVVSNGQQGSAFATFNENSYRFQYILHHNLGSAVTGAMVVDGNGDLVFNLKHGTSPVRGLRDINDRLWEQLYTGQWSFVLTTDAYPNGELKGKLGCVGTCTAPNAASAADPCNPPGQVAYPFKGNNADGTNFAGSWQPVKEYGATFDISVAKDGALCDGIVAGAFKNNVANYQSSCADGNCQYARAYWDLVSASGAAKYYRIDLNTYKYLHFHVRGGVDSPVWQMEVGFLSRKGIPDGMGWTSNGGYGGCCGKVVVLQKYMDNEYIDGGWTKVAIPLVDFGFPSSGAKNIEDIRAWEYQRQFAGNQERWFEIDEMYFSSEPGDFGGRITTPPHMHTTGPCLQGGDATWQQRKVSESELSQDCIGQYQAWGECSASCSQTQEFVVSRAAANGGTPCASDNTRDCGDGQCKIDCQGTWSNWSQCLSSCRSTRTFTTTVHPNANGNACPGPTQSKQCTGGACAQDCQGEFAAEFDTCSIECVQTKPFVVSVEPSNGGQLCPADLQVACTGGDCTQTPNTDQDCVGYWDEAASSWTDPEQCSQQCTRSKPYVITTPKSGNGQACALADGEVMTAGCSTGLCVADCEVQWDAQWAECDQSCQTTLSYQVLVQPNAGGTSCPELRSQPCTGGTCQQDCVIQLGAYPNCPASCKRTRGYEVVTQPTNGGVPCEDLSTFPAQEACFDDQCDLSNGYPDCQVQFGEWSVCVADVDSVSCQQERSVSFVALEQQAQCPPADTEQRHCQPTEFVEQCKCTVCNVTPPVCASHQQLVTSPPNPTLGNCCPSYDCAGTSTPSTQAATPMPTVASTLFSLHSSAPVMRVAVWAVALVAAVHLQ